FAHAIRSRQHVVDVERAGRADRDRHFTRIENRIAVLVQKNAEPADPGVAAIEHSVGVFIVEDTAVDAAGATAGQRDGRANREGDAGISVVLSDAVLLDEEYARVARGVGHAITEI